MTASLSPALRRGACPTLATPMAVADGLLARFRPVGGLTPAQLTALGSAAERFGNGRIEVTARGSIQVRGLSKETETGFREALDAERIAARIGVTIECSPIAGDDPNEVRDPRALEETIKAVCDEALARGPLSPKLAIVIDSGGQIALDSLKADIRLIAQTYGWAMSVAERGIGVFAESDIPEAIGTVLAALQATGPAARGKDICGKLGTHLFPARAAGTMDLGFRQTSDVARFVLIGNHTAVRIGVAYGQIRGSQLVTLANFMAANGINEARPAPERTFVLVGEQEIPVTPLEALGFTVGATAKPSLCSGAEIVENGVIHAADIARALAKIADGSFHLHVSTCAKGCAYRGRPGIVLSGHKLSIYGGAAQRPFASIDPAAIEGSISALTARIREMCRDGETTLATMTRLGPQ